MNFDFDYRQIDSPYVHNIWHTYSTAAGTFMSRAGCQWEMVITRYQRHTTVTVRGPETFASPADCPPDAEFFGIQFKLGTFMPHLPSRTLVNGQIHLPAATGDHFWLNGDTWQLPRFENAETFVDWMIHAGLLVRDPIVEATLQGQLTDVSLRSVQRRFWQATGLTHSAIRTIERASLAAELLAQGVSILDTVELAGYADQPHLTRSLKRLIGYTPAQLLRVAALS